MHKDRFIYLAGDLAPQRKIMTVTRKPEEIVLELECGHRKLCVTHFSYEVGRETRCRKCGEDRVRQTAEFKQEGFTT